MLLEQDPLCTSPDEESGPLANNAPLNVWEGMSGGGQFNVLLVNPSFMDWTPCRWTRNSNFTVSALPDCVRLKGLEVVSATIRNECLVVMPSS